MATYLIDANLPRWFVLWAGSEFVFAHDLGSDWIDARIWDYARARGSVIVTKDTDFRIRALVEGPPPRVVHVRFGNLKMREFFRVMSARWPEVVPLLDSYRIIEVWIDRVVAIS